MRISDWSSDVCSSDLTGAEPRELLQQRRAERDQAIAEVQQFDARITQKQIRAPFAGELGIRRVNLGQYLNPRSEEHTSELQSLMRISYAVFCLKKKNNIKN